jgi:futalosine hydrolase
MNVLIVAATKLEIEPFIKLNLAVDVLITSVGVPAAMYHLQKKLQSKKYQIVIQAGIAGSFTSKLALGQVVIVERDCFADIGISEKGQFNSIFDTILADKNLFPYQNGWLINPTLIKEKVPVSLVIGVTINMVSDSATQRKMLKEKYNAEIESMEGAALHYVCLQEGVAFLQLRSISNMVGERDKTKWAMKDAINNLNRELVRFLNPKEK